MGSVAAISLGLPPGRRRLSRCRRWSLDRCLLNCLEKTRSGVGRVDGVMATFLKEAKRRMIDQCDYKNKLRLTIVREPAGKAILHCCRPFKLNGAGPWRLLELKLKLFEGLMH
jgi:hypothetical protein